jgi:dUTP pyrophosphatase
MTQDELENGIGGENPEEYVKLIQQLQKIMGNVDDGMNTEDDESLETLFKQYGLDSEYFNENEILNYSLDSLKKELPYKVLNDEAVEPSYNYGGDSGFDLYSVEDVDMDAFSRVLVPTGLSFNVPDGFEIQVRPKSGLALNYGLTVLNTPGTIDSGYIGEIKVILFNTTPNKVVIEKGTKVAQAVLCPVVNGKWVNLVKKEDFDQTDRGNNGFGSTGLK